MIAQLIQKLLIVLLWRAWVQYRYGQPREGIWLFITWNHGWRQLIKWGHYFIKECQNRRFSLIRSWDDCSSSRWMDQSTFSSSCQIEVIKPDGVSSLKMTGKKNGLIFFFLPRGYLCYCSYYSEIAGLDLGTLLYHYPRYTSICSSQPPLLLLLTFRTWDSEALQMLSDCREMWPTERLMSNFNRACLPADRL